MGKEMFTRADFGQLGSAAPENADEESGNDFSTGGEEYIQKGIDLNEQFLRNKNTSFLLRVRGDAMIGAGIHDGDIVIVDKSIKAAGGKVVVAMLDGEMLIRRLERTFNKMRLLPETNKLAPIDIDPLYSEFSIWGVVTYVIHEP